jgi:hypothetical protein
VCATAIWLAKLAPREAAQGGIEGLDGPLANDDVEEPTEAKAPGRHEPGAEFGTATGRVEPESDSPTRSMPPATSRWCPAAWA